MSDPPANSNDNNGSIHTEGNSSKEKDLLEKNENSATETTIGVKENAPDKNDSKENDIDKSSSDEYAKNVEYNQDGIAIYTDPKTNYKYKWCSEKKDWTPLEGNEQDTSVSNPYENEHYNWCSETNQWIPKETKATTDTPTETEFYKWDAEKKEWIPKTEQNTLNDVVYGMEDGLRTCTDKDGAVFFWEAEKKAWFPKIDDDFMARYQMSYGFIDNTTPAEVKEPQSEEVIIPSDESNSLKRKASQEPPKWFEVTPDQNTKVYVSNLPLDITEAEFLGMMAKYGFIMKDLKTDKYKIKLYTDSNGELKGDGLCDYIKVESVELALNILDGSDLRGHKIQVQRAQFQMRGEYNPALKPKKQKKDKEKILKMKEKLFDWRPEKMRFERSKHERVVVLKNLFSPTIFDKEVQLIIEYQNNLREECLKCGTVRKVVVYDRHPEGIAQITMADPSEADLVIQMMNGRPFGKRVVAAEAWDGKTKYKIDETEEEKKKRLSIWDNYLETDEEKANRIENAETNAEGKKTEISAAEPKENPLDETPEDNPGESPAETTENSSTVVPSAELAN